MTFKTSATERPCYVVASVGPLIALGAADAMDCLQGKTVFLTDMILC